MNDRRNMKWKPFNAVIPGNELRNKKILKVPILSQNEILELEELLKFSLYTGEKITITYLKNNNIITEVKIVKKINSVNKNIYFTDSNIINFRQICNIKKTG